MNCHMHLTPRRQNDHSNPTGGIIRTFPDKADYRKQLQQKRSSELDDL